jgi:hypothetical protein
MRSYSLPVGLPAKTLGAGNWDTTHNPFVRPLGCNRRYGNSGRNGHKNRGEPICDKCLTSAAHYAREWRRKAIKPRTLEPCGTHAAAERHRRNNEPIDMACRLADAAKSQEYRDNQKADNGPGPA